MEFKPAVVKSPVSGTVGNLSFAKGDMVEVSLEKNVIIGKKFTKK